MPDHFGGRTVRARTQFLPSVHALTERAGTLTTQISGFLGEVRAA
jgi:hypothetical protein